MQNRAWHLDDLPRFNRPATDLATLPPPRLPMSYTFEYVMDRLTPDRKMADVAIRALMPFLEGDHSIIELGAGGDYYRNFVSPGQRYEMTNILGSGEIKTVDATKMPYPNGSVSALASMFMLEHVYDYRAVLNECFRCLRPGGRLLLAVPFLYYAHARPYDYFRFSSAALEQMLASFTILKAFSLGNREIAVAEFYCEKTVMGSRNNAIVRTLLRLAAVPALMVGILGGQHDTAFASSQVWLCEKPPTPSTSS